jgi:hypothetical protein
MDALGRKTCGTMRTVKPRGRGPPTLQGNRIWVLDAYCLVLQKRF